jgi:uncharacterized membrane protein YccC
MAPAETIKAKLQDMAWLRSMDWFRGLRAATAISAPLLLGDALHQPELAWAALGGFEAIISDKGGPYRSRIGSLGLLTAAGGVGCMLGALVAGHLAYAFPVTLLWCFAWTYFLVLGEPFASAGPLIQVIYICGLGAPTGDVRLAATHAGFLILGGLWSMALSLFLWPLDAYRPARFAISDCYHELGTFLGSIHELNLRKQTRPALWHRLARHHQSRLRSALEKARHAISSVRAERAAETFRGRNLVVLLESADMLLARSVALAEYMEMTANVDPSPCTLRGKSALLLLEQAENWISEVLRYKVDRIDEACQSYQARLQRIPPEMKQCMSPEDVSGQFLLHQITDATRMLETSLECATAVRTGRETRHKASDAPNQSDLQLVPPSIPFEQLRANWKRESLMFRHAARVAVVCAVNVCIMMSLKIDHGYWMMLTSLIVLQPNVGGTFRRSFQRIGGTVAGGLLAAFLAVFLHSQALTAAVLFPLAFCALAVLPVSYSLFCFFLTPTFVLAFLPYVGDWQIAGVRMLDTLLGAVIAMVAMAVLWPALERRRFSLQLARSLGANQRYLETLQASWAPGDPAAIAGQTRALAQARRAIGLAHNDAEDSLDRLRLEPAWTARKRAQTGTRATEAAIAFVTYLRRFGQSITTLASFPGNSAWKRSTSVQQRLERLGSALSRLQLALEAGSVSWDETAALTALEEDASLDENHNGQRQLDRMERQVTVLQRSMEAMQRAGLLSPRNPGAPATSPTHTPVAN